MGRSSKAGSIARDAQSRFLKLGWLLAALLSGSLAVWAAFWCLADVLHANGVAMLYKGLESAENLEQWDRGWALLENARAINSMHAEYPFYQAYFSHNRAQSFIELRERLSDDRNQSIEYFNQALRIRPHWGYVWAELAEARLVNGDGSDQTLDALDKALQFAPHEPFVLHIALRVGFTFWDRFDEGRRQRLFSAVRYLLQHDPRFVIETALLFKWAEHLSPLLTDDKEIDYLNSRLVEQSNSFSSE